MITGPLADRMRPESFAHVYGDAKLFSENGIFSRMIKTGHIPNMIFYGPSGTGKTTSANILAKASGKTLYKLNATSAGISDIKDIIAQTNSFLGSDGILLYLDEIQYFNKKQQQSLLEFIEDGRITLIASTTENPYFYVYPAIISRSAVFEFKPIEVSELEKAVLHAKEYWENETGRKIEIEAEALRSISLSAAGDARRAINLFENVASLAGEKVTLDDIKVFLPEVMGMSGFDKAGDGHYDLVSALQKSIRGSDPDAAIFYLAKLLAGGDLISACRRLQVIASEDIGLAYPQGAILTRACVESAKELGLPEAAVPLAHATVALATAPKSNASYMAYHAAAADVAAGKGAVPPRALQNVHFDGVNSEEKGQNYKYPHDYPNHYVKQQYLPNDLAGTCYYRFGENKNEQAATAYWERIKGVLPENMKK
ncbi:MAG: replication-associated recombination protein A [Clostridia bacterium]|nr:replication-associated recombination protein A [Clostridia bacterium]